MSLQVNSWGQTWLGVLPSQLGSCTCLGAAGCWLILGGLCVDCWESSALFHVSLPAG